MHQSNTLANRLALLRHEKGLTQQELANILSELENRERSYSLLSVSGWESGDKYPPVKVLLALCEYFNVSSDYLLGLTEEPGNKNITAASRTDADTHEKPNYLITYNELKSFHKEPVYVVFNDKSFEDAWGTYDAVKNRIVFTNQYLYITKDLNCNYYTKMPDELAKPKYSLRRRLSMGQLVKSGKVWIEMITTSEYVRGQYDGWYRVNENSTCLINSQGLTLPFEGLNVSYNAYTGDMSDKIMAQ